MPITVLEHGAEAVGVDLEDVEEVDDPRVRQVLVDIVLAEGVLDVVGLLVVLPVLVQLVDLAGNVALLLCVEALKRIFLFRRQSFDNILKYVIVPCELPRILLFLEA